MNKILITICARCNSKGVKNKNIRLLNGRPLIYYTIKQAMDWGKSEHIIVSTDSEEIAEIAKEYGAEVPFIRASDLARDNSAKIPVIRHALGESERIYEKKFEIIIDLDVTSPIRKTSDLDMALELFLEKNPNVLYSVVPANKNPYFNMVEIDKHGKAFISKISDHPFYRRQDAPKVYNMNASIYIYDREFIINKENNSPQSDNSIAHIMNEFSGVDIDNELDFKYIEFLIKEGLVVL